MAAAIVVRVTPELHREVVRRAGLARLPMQQWVVRLLRAECGLPGERRPTVTERLAAEWAIPGQRRIGPTRALGGRRAARGVKAGASLDPREDLAGGASRCASGQIPA